MPEDRSDRWEGGFRRKTKDGRKIYVIFKRVAGKLYCVSTRATVTSSAMEHLKRFQANPEAYRPEGDPPRERLVLDTDLAGAFLEWSRDTKRNTLKHLQDQRRALAWWQDQLGDTDVREVTTARLLKELDRLKAGRKNRIATLKSFFAWLRTERHLITTAQDPTYGQIRAPIPNVAQRTKAKALSREQFNDAVKRLGEGWARDGLLVLGATGWHVTELERFAAGGSTEKHPHTGAPVLVCPRTKAGDLLRTEVSAEVLAAAKRLRERGHFSHFSLRDALTRVGASFNTPGHLRHSVATWAVNAGADPAQVSAFLNHKSLATTRKFYATHAVPLKVPTLADVPKRRARR